MVRTAYQALSRQDAAAILELLDPDVEFRNPDYAMEAGIRRGREEFRIALERGWEVMREMRFDVERVIDEGDVIVVLGRFTAVGRTGGVPIESPFGHVLELRGDKAVSVSWFQNHDEAFAAAGISHGHS